MDARNHSVIANLDLVILVAALPVFLIAGFSLAGYAIAAAVWIGQRLIQAWAERKARTELAAGRRNKALGAVAATSLARPWLMAAVVLIACIVNREAGLYAAVLLVVLFTLNIASRGLVHLLDRSDGAGEAK